MTRLSLSRIRRLGDHSVLHSSIQCDYTAKNAVRLVGLSMIGGRTSEASFCASESFYCELVTRSAVCGTDEPKSAAVQSMTLRGVVVGGKLWYPTASTPEEEISSAFNDFVSQIFPLEVPFFSLLAIRLMLQLNQSIAASIAASDFLPLGGEPMLEALWAPNTLSFRLLRWLTGLTTLTDLLLWQRAEC